MLRQLSTLTRRFQRASDAGAELPIREELYSIERLQQYAVALAAEHKIAEKPHRVSLLLPRLEENGRKLLAAYRALAESIRKEHVISPAAEWLVDNFHFVEEQVREIREDLPKSYYIRRAATYFCEASIIPCKSKRAVVCICNCQWRAKLFPSVALLIPMLRDQNTSRTRAAEVFSDQAVFACRTAHVFRIKLVRRR